MKRGAVLVTLLLSIVTGCFVPTATAAAADGSTIVFQWKNTEKRSLFVRSGAWNGNKGFGWVKIQTKHNIHKFQTLRFISNNPKGATFQGSDALYEAYANKKVCTDGKCTYTDSIPVRLVMAFEYVSNYYGVDINGTLGVKTSYCIADDRSGDCPDWVDLAFAGTVFSTSSDKYPSAMTTTVEMSYSPRTRLSD
ncbi:hypothetical protein [Rathayibacter sp. AY1A3]|uniref:hypothetical protein n=1 Tax=Rathayibacter sp. AY1A3 TaxID=2080521 RepID=UPI000CE88E03|nr:hypothetical protein [Rathayibacter sp. AY1A3]PPF38003.1 hypothetical protein C5C10_04485 [Rathayibacter sp. AY1A3]